MGEKRTDEREGDDESQERSRVNFHGCLLEECWLRENESVEWVNLQFLLMILIVLLILRWQQSIQKKIRIRIMIKSTITSTRKSPNCFRSPGF